jgi:ceramide glucosyltransferase
LTYYLGAALISLSACGILYTLLAGVLTRRFLSQKLPQPGDFPAVSVLKPLHAAEPGLTENLRSFLVQDYPAPVQRIFGLHSRSDSALPVAENLAQAHPESGITVVVDGRRHGSNAKISNLINMFEHARHDVLLLSDSDIAVEPDYLHTIAAAMESPGVGLVTCLYRGVPGASLWSKLSAMAINYYFLPNVIMGLRLGLARPCFGSTIAIKRSVLAEIGGLSIAVNHLADDYRLGEAATSRGYGIAIPPIVLAHGCPESSVGEVVDHEIRWARTIRAIDPGGFLGSFVTQPLAAAALGALLLGFPLWSVAVILLTLAARLFLRRQVDGALGTSAGPWWWLPVREVLSIVVFVSAFFGMRVNWRGRSFRIGPKGELIAIEEH